MMLLVIIISVIMIIIIIIIIIVVGLKAFFFITERNWQYMRKMLENKNSIRMIECSLSVCMSLNVFFRGGCVLSEQQCGSNPFRLASSMTTLFCCRIKCHVRLGHLQTKAPEVICRYKQSQIRHPGSAVREIQ